MNNKLMKKLLLCTAITALGTTSLVGSNFNNKALAQSEIVTADTLARDQALRTLEKIQLQVKIVRNDDASIAVSMESLTDEGMQSGMNKMLLEAIKASEVAEDGSKTYNLSFDKASKVDEVTGEKLETPLPIPFAASLVPAPTMENGDEFELEVDPVELVNAWERLNEEKVEIEEEEEENTLALEESDRSGSSQDQKDEEPDNDFESPTFGISDDEEPVITTQLCPVKVDIAQMAAIVMEETLIDGVSEGGCQETLSRYPLVKKFASCPLTPNLEDMVMNKAYTLSYNDPNAGEVQAQGCTDDPEERIALTETTEGCGIFHDFDAGTSNQQSKLVYEHMGVVQTLQTCQNSDVEYSHVVSRAGCDPLVDDVNKTVTFTEKTTIDVDGTTQEILGCIPNNTTTTAILEEDCTGSQKYSHDMLAGQSFKNKTYYYMDGGNRQDVLTCQPSSETFAHNIDETLCAASHNDVAKVTTLRGKPVIDDGGQIEIGQCQDISPTIPYTDIGAQWKTNTTAVSNLQLASVDSGYLNVSGSQMVACARGRNRSCIGGFFTDLCPEGNTFAFASKFKPMNDKHWCVSGISGYSGNTNINLSGAKYCVRGSIVGNWELSNGVVLDKANSPDSPNFTGGVNHGGYTIQNRTNAKLIAGSGASGTITYNCSQPTCLVETLRAHPVWQRGDLSEYVDNTITTDTKYTCGISGLDGTDY